MLHFKAAKLAQCNIKVTIFQVLEPVCLVKFCFPRISKFQINFLLHGLHSIRPSIGFQIPSEPISLITESGFPYKEQKNTNKQTYQLLLEFLSHHKGQLKTGCLQELTFPIQIPLKVLEKLWKVKQKYVIILKSNFMQDTDSPELPNSLRVIKFS